MSYPYGPESYPTFEALEDKHALERLRMVFYYELYRMTRERNAAAADARMTFDASGIGDGDVYGSIGKGGIVDEPNLEDMGVAFAHALEYAFDDEDKLDRFFQDFFAILEDKVVSRTDAEDGDWSEDEGRLGEIAAIERMLADGNVRDAKAYEEDLAAKMEEHRSFVDGKIEALSNKARAMEFKHRIGGGRATA